MEQAGGAVDRDALLGAAMARVPLTGGAEVAVAALDPASGASAAWGAGRFETASIVKVGILAALLLRAGDAGREPTVAERAHAAAMIVRSDNDSASALWRAIGGARGLDAAHERLGLTRTEGGEGTLWGLTRTTAVDQVALLRQLFVADGSLLGGDARACVTGLMERIAEGQRWGVSAAADGSAWALKNGWLRRSTTGLWVVNSVGRVTTGGRDRLVAVVSRGSATLAEGISLVEAAARAAVSATGAGGPGAGQKSS
ncbi:serine hydrolase [Streptomyces parvulus]|uniref:serine hydrolase n=1 Tax=Streptomyces parvulus TaxID=146923 RepID=UPI003F4C6681